MNRAPRRHPPRPSPLLAVVVALSLLADGVWRTLHLARVHHAVCPAHGELLHVAAAVQRTSPTAAGYASSGPTLEDRSSIAAPSHDTCPFQPYGRATEGNPARRILVADVAPDLVAPLPSTGTVSPPSVPRFLLAPKQSPPA